MAHEGRRVQHALAGGRDEGTRSPQREGRSLSANAIGVGTRCASLPAGGFFPRPREPHMTTTALYWYASIFGWLFLTGIGLPPCPEEAGILYAASVHALHPEVWWPFAWA